MPAPSWDPQALMTCNQLLCATPSCALIPCKHWGSSLLMFVLECFAGHHNSQEKNAQHPVPTAPSGN